MGAPLAELRKLPGYSTDKAAERAQAKKLLAEAGFPNGLKVAMAVRRGQQFESAAILLKDHLSQVGIEANIEVLETAAYLDRMARRDFEISGGSFSTAVDDPDAILGPDLPVQRRPQLRKHVRPRGREALPRAVPQIRDYKARLQVVNQMERAALGTVMKAVLGFRVTWFLYSSAVRNYRPQYTRYLAETREQVWLARS